MVKERLTGQVSYMLGTSLFEQVELLAASQGISANEWCRESVIKRLESEGKRECANQQDFGVTLEDREEIGRLFLIMLFKRAKFLMRQSATYETGAMEIAFGIEDFFGRLITKE
jgi:hypothetical protein